MRFAAGRFARPSVRTRISCSRSIATPCAAMSMRPGGGTRRGSTPISRPRSRPRLKVLSPFHDRLVDRVLPGVATDEDEYGSRFGGDIAGHDVWRDGHTAHGHNGILRRPNRLHRYAPALGRLTTGTRLWRSCSVRLPLGVARKREAVHAPAPATSGSRQGWPRPRQGSVKKPAACSHRRFTEHVATSDARRFRSLPCCRPHRPLGRQSRSRIAFPGRSLTLGCRVHLLVPWHSRPRWSYRLPWRRWTNPLGPPSWP